MYLPTSEEKQRCFKIVKEIKKIEDDEIVKRYVDETLKIAYSIGGSYDDEMTLKKIIESL